MEPHPGGNNDNEDKGDLILTVEKGKISLSSTVNPPTNKFKWITIEGTHNIVYEHIFINGSIGGDGLKVGGCILKNIDSTGFDPEGVNNWAIIFQVNGQYNAIGPINGSKVKFKDELGTLRTLTVYDTVAQGAAVAPLGNSGNGFPFHAHIQGMSMLYANGQVIQVGLNEGDKYAKNPLEYIAHTSPTFAFALSRQGLASGISPVYPGNSPTPLLAKVTLSGEADGKRYKNSIVDIEKLEFKVKHNFFTNWVNIRGPKNDRIQFGGRDPNTLKPDQLRTQGRGDWNRTGVIPRTYWNHNYDEFYFAEFYARIHKNDPMNGTGVFATYPWDARYPDGDYELKAGITNVNNTEPDNWSAISPFEIDNFKPFIRAVGVYTASVGGFNEQIYYREWISQNAGVGRLRLAGAMRRQPLFIDQQSVTIYALASEPMRRMQAKIDNLTGWAQGVPVPYTPTDPDTWGNQKWRFTFNSVTFTADNCYTIIFVGGDLYGNAMAPGHQLLLLPVPPDCANQHDLSFAVPHRTGTDTWSPGPTQEWADLVHKFPINKCGMLAEFSGSPCITSQEVEYDITGSASQQAVGAIHMTIAGGSSGMDILWTNAAGNVVGHTEELTNLAAGLYCVEIKKDCCTFTDCIEVKNCNWSIVAEVAYPAVGMSDGAISLTPYGLGPYQFLWSNGAITNPLTALAAGSYQVTVTDMQHCAVVKAIVLPSCPAIQVSANAVVTVACGGANGSIEVSSVGASGGLPPYAYHWLDASGNPLDQPKNLVAGHYCLVATDANGCTASQCFEVGDAAAADAIYIREIKNVSTCYVHPTPVVFDACDGAITVEVEASAMLGGGPFSFDWSGPNGFTATGPGIAGLCVGFYAVTVSNPNGCAVTKSFNICCCNDQSTKGSFPNACPKEPFTISDEFTVVEPLTPENNYRGSIDLAISGSAYSTGYYYAWSGPDGFAAHTEDIEGLVAGKYCVAVTNGCKEEVVRCYELGICDAAHTPKLGIYVSSSCASGHSGRIDVSIYQAMTPYTIAWPGGSVTTLSQPYTIKGLEAGTYTITVTDAKYCTATVNATIGSTPNNMYDFDFPMSEVDPFETVHPCFKGIFKPKIKIRGDDFCLGGITHIEPNEYPYRLDIEWPDLSNSILMIEDGGGCHTIGPDVFDVPIADLYHCAVIDQYGCRKEWCFEFGEETIEAYPWSNLVTPPGTGTTPIRAFDECMKCTNCGNMNCSNTGSKDCKVDGFEKFEYKPSVAANPCSGGGIITVPCNNTVIIVPPSSGTEYIDWDSGVGVAEGVCEYRVGCLFPGLDDPFFQSDPFFQQTPVYVETTIQVNNPSCHKPTQTPGNPYMDCPLGVTYAFSEDQDCWGTVTCLSTGLVIFEGVLKEFTRICTRKNLDGTCDKLLFCTLTKPDVLLEVLAYNIECPSPTDCFPDPPLCEPCMAASPNSDDRDNKDNTPLKKVDALKIRAYPNPFDQFLAVEFQGADEQGSAQILVTDLLGRTMMSRTISTHLGTNRFIISNGRDFALGIYYVSVKDSAGQLTTTKVVRMAK